MKNVKANEGANLNECAVNACAFQLDWKQTRWCTQFAPPERIMFQSPTSRHQSCDLHPSPDSLGQADDTRVLPYFDRQLTHKEHHPARPLWENTEVLSLGRSLWQMTGSQTVISFSCDSPENPEFSVIVHFTGWSYIVLTRFMFYAYCIRLFTLITFDLK
jgi:hypothetical protein